MKKLLYISLLMAMVASCQPQKNIVAIEKNENAVTLAKGQSCEIKFITNASTGYWWQWTNSKEVTVVDSTGNRYVGNAPKGVVGASSTQYWKFTAVEKGTQTLHFVYARNRWDEAVRSRDVTVTVK